MNINKENIQNSVKRIELMRNIPEFISKKLRGDGYKYVTKSGKLILVHRLIWEEQFGTIPEGIDIHHKDGNKQNNKIENLELLTRKEHKNKHKNLKN